MFLRLAVDGERILWRADPESLEMLVLRVERAIRQRNFIPAEPMTIQGARGEWLRIYAEIVEQPPSS